MLAPFRDVAATTRPRDLAIKWTAMLTVPGDGHWGQHADFGQPLAHDGPAALVGKSRAADMVVNILLPLMVACADRERLPALRETAFHVYSLYPKLEENKITRAMADEALGPRKDGAIKSARRQQGLMHLYRLYCEVRRCYECPVSGLARR